ncbi:MAG: hypothetical protein WDZ40_02075 [Candidatus Spechtbacterales bacterium]
MEILQQIFNNLPSNIAEDPISAINGILYSRFFLIVQLFSFLLSAFLFWYWIHLLRKTGIITAKVSQLRDAWHESPVPKGKLVSQWKRVEERISSEQEAEWKLAILEADSILDEVIKALGYKGNVMGERMRQIKPEQFPRLDDAWRVHKVRNFIAHDPSYPLSREAAERTINIYKDILKEFKIFE